MGELTFSQKRVSSRTSFAFGDQEFRYGLRDRNGVRELAADYMSVGSRRTRIRRADLSGLKLALLLLVIGCGFVWLDTRLGVFNPLSLLWLLPGILLTGLVLTRRIRFTVFEAAGEPVLIIEDKRLPKIVAELETRRRSRLAELYSPLNLANDGDLEIRKIEWLVAENVFTREQADDQIAQVHAAHAPRHATSALFAQEPSGN